MEDQTSIEQPQGETDEHNTEAQAGSPSVDVEQPAQGIPNDQPEIASIIPPEQVDQLQTETTPPVQATEQEVTEPAAPAQSEVAGDPVSGDGEPSPPGIDFPLLKSEVLALGKRIFGEMTTLEHEAEGFVLRVAGEIKHIVRLQ